MRLYNAIRSRLLASPWFYDPQEMRFSQEDRIMSARGMMSIVFGLIAVVVAGCCFGGSAVDWHYQHVVCTRLSEQTGYPTRMVGNWISGECYVNVGGRWIPAERYYTIDDGDER